MPASEDITCVLRAAAEGQALAAEQLFPLIYNELRGLAGARMANLAPGSTLQPTALVHEAYLRLVGREDPGWTGRIQFFAAAARAMRDIVIEHARRKSRRKRGGDRKRLAIDPNELHLDAAPDEILAIDEALKTLEQHEPRSARVVALRYFGGLTEPETAALLGVSESTVARDWRYARAWLYRALSGAENGP